MQTPDANGCVTIQWPSNSVPHGGIFHTRIVDRSDDTRDFLKVLLKESQLSIEQRDKARWESRLRQEETRGRHPQREPVSTYRPRTSRRRSLSVIQESGDYDIDTYRPLKRCEDRELLKQRLQRAMEFGDGDEQQLPKPPRPPRKQPNLLSPREMRNELITQIRERTEWLSEMEALGEGSAHRDVIRNQIGERLRALDALGIDECSSARSTASGFSTMGSIHMSPGKSARSRDSARSKASGRRTAKKAAPPATAAQKPKLTAAKTLEEETILGYRRLPVLAYSPRRRL